MVYFIVGRKDRYMDYIWEKDRRKYPRLEVDIPVQFISEHETENARIKDISGGGCRLRVSIPIPKGVSIIMEFSIDDMDVIVKAAPVWESHIPEEEVYNIGVMFIDISEKTKDKIIRYISEKITFIIE